MHSLRDTVIRKMQFCFIAYPIWIVCKVGHSLCMHAYDCRVAPTILQIRKKKTSFVSHNKSPKHFFNWCHTLFTMKSNRTIRKSFRNTFTIVASPIAIIHPNIVVWSLLTTTTYVLIICNTVFLRIYLKHTHIWTASHSW